MQSLLTARRSRADIIVKDQRNSRSAVIEVKHASASAELASLVEVGLQQIDDKEYDAPLRDNYETVIHGEWRSLKSDV